MTGAGRVGGAALAELLEQRLWESGQAPEARVTVAELHRVLLPYGLCRDVLGYATKAEYDLALLGLLRKDGRVEIVENRFSEAVERELGAPEPGLGFLRDFAASEVRLRFPVAGGLRGDVAEPEDTELDAESDAEPDVAESDAEPADVARTDAWLAELEEAGGVEPERPAPAGTAGPCRGCGEALPDRPGFSFCPHCGADQRIRRCETCGEELERGWAFCPRCGAAAAEA